MLLLANARVIALAVEDEIYRYLYALGGPPLLVAAAIAAIGVCVAHWALRPPARRRATLIHPAVR
jgi:hypothetical protein